MLKILASYVTSDDYCNQCHRSLDYAIHLDAIVDGVNSLKRKEDINAATYKIMAKTIEQLLEGNFICCE